MRILSRLTILLFFFPILGCGPSNYILNQQIKMGPFVFEVTGASEGFDYLTSASGGRYKKIYIDLLLDPEKCEKTSIRFDDFMNGMSKGNKLIIFPAMKIKDKSGVEFDGDVKKISGGTRWRAEFWLIVHRRGIKSRLDYLDRTTSDYNLIIKNPDKRKGQPGTIKIKLS